MGWRIYTKVVALPGGVGLRWQWRNPVGEESKRQFIRIALCEADAAQHGYAGTSDEAPIRAYTPPRLSCDGLAGVQDLPLSPGRRVALSNELDALFHRDRACANALTNTI